jgi:hypothetical protein
MTLCIGYYCERYEFNSVWQSEMYFSAGKCGYLVAQVQSLAACEIR